VDVNSISNSLASLNETSNKKLSKADSVSKVEINNDSLRLTIKEYNQQRDELSHSLQTFNKGIGLSRTAQNALNKQEENLTNIQSKLADITDNEANEDRNSIKDELNNELTNFKQEASVKYQRRSLLSLEGNQRDTTITISAKEGYFSIDKPNTPAIATKLSQDISKNNFNIPEQLEATKQSVDTSIKQIQDIKIQFSNFEKGLENSARDSIQAQMELSNQNNKRKTDFTQEAIEFSKTNVQENNGYLAASQANIVQDQSISLLS
jgi:flagellin-like hook-associated protein FlgL